MADSFTWQLQDAKAHFSGLVQKTIDEGPQIITRRGKASVVMVSNNEFTRLVRRGMDLLSFLRSAPNVDLSVERSREGSRAIDL